MIAHRNGSTWYFLWPCPHMVWRVSEQLSVPVQLLRTSPFGICPFQRRTSGKVPTSEVSSLSLLWKEESSESLIFWFIISWALRTQIAVTNLHILTWIFKFGSLPPLFSCLTDLLPGREAGVFKLPLLEGSQFLILLLWKGREFFRGLNLMVGSRKREAHGPLFSSLNLTPDGGKLKLGK